MNLANASSTCRMGSNWSIVGVIYHWQGERGRKRGRKRKREREWVSEQTLFFSPSTNTYHVLLWHPSVPTPHSSIPFLKYVRTCVECTPVVTTGWKHGCWQQALRWSCPLPSCIKAIPQARTSHLAIVVPLGESPFWAPNSLLLAWLIQPSPHESLVVKVEHAVHVELVFFSCFGWWWLFHGKPADTFYLELSFNVQMTIGIIWVMKGLGRGESNPKRLFVRTSLVQSSRTGVQISGVVSFIYWLEHIVVLVLILKGHGKADLNVLQRTAGGMIAQTLLLGCHLICRWFKVKSYARNVRCISMISSSTLLGQGLVPNSSWTIRLFWLQER